MARISRSDIKRIFLTDAERLKKRASEARARFDEDQKSKIGESPANEIINRIVKAGTAFVASGGNPLAAVGSQFAPVSKKLQPLESAVGGGATGFGISSATGGETDPLKALSILGKPENVGKTAGVLQTVSGKPIEGLQAIGKEVTAEKKATATVAEETAKEVKKTTEATQKKKSADRKAALNEFNKRTSELRKNIEFAAPGVVKTKVNGKTVKTTNKDIARKALAEFKKTKKKFIASHIKDLQVNKITAVGQTKGGKIKLSDGRIVTKDEARQILKG